MMVSVHQSRVTTTRLHTCQQKVRKTNVVQTFQNRGCHHSLLLSAPAWAARPHGRCLSTQHSVQCKWIRVSRYSGPDAYKHNSRQHRVVRWVVCGQGVSLFAIDASRRGMAWIFHQRGHHIIDTTGESFYQIDGREKELLR